MNMLNCNNSCDNDHSIDPKFIPDNFDVKNVFNHCLKTCAPKPCKDIREGIYLFTGPKTIRSLCDANNKCNLIDDGSIEKRSPFKHSFPIYRESSIEGCDKIVGAIWRDSNHEYTIKCEGKYYIKYTWDNCLETEPKFEEINVCCDPCCN